MQVIFWGTRGSLPAPVTVATMREKVTRTLEAVLEHGPPDEQEVESFMDAHLPFAVRGSYGTNTSCLEVRTQGEDDVIIADAGTGIRDLGNHYLRAFGPGQPRTYHLLFTHFHWDHIMGLPFFTPAYIPGNKVIIYALHEDVERLLTVQMREPHFPVPFASLGADFEFVTLAPKERRTIAGVAVTAWPHVHPNLAYGYRFDLNGSSFVYSTDCEHAAGKVKPGYAMLDFYRDADYLAFDAMYSFADARTIRMGWGHSSNITGVELAKLANVKTLCLFHQDPVSTDRELDSFLEDTRAYAALYRPDQPLDVIMAYDGLKVDI